VVTKSLGALKRNTGHQEFPPLRSCIPTQQVGTTMACFDGATQSNGQQCGAGGVIKTSDFSVYRWTFNCGEGTNTREELLGVWATLTLATRLAIRDIQVLGDSKIVIDWLNDKGSLQACALESWKNRIRDLIKNFREISFAHIYREYNREADLLSKQAIQKPEGKISYYTWVDGKEGPTMFINLY
jgi:ribonuclease HI